MLGIGYGSRLFAIPLNGSGFPQIQNGLASSSSPLGVGGAQNDLSFEETLIPFGQLLMSFMSQMFTAFSTSGQGEAYGDVGQSFIPALQSFFQDWLSPFLSSGSLDQFAKGNDGGDDDDDDDSGIPAPPAPIAPPSPMGPPLFNTSPEATSPSVPQPNGVNPGATAPGGTPQPGAHNPNIYLNDPSWAISKGMPPSTQRVITEGSQFGVAKVYKRSGAENGGNHHIYISVVDAQGRPIGNVPIELKNANGQVINVKSSDKGAINHAMWSHDDYTVSLVNPDGTRTSVTGMTSRFIERPQDTEAGNSLFHMSWDVVFVKKPDGTVVQQPLAAAQNPFQYDNQSAEPVSQPLSTGGAKNQGEGGVDSVDAQSELSAEEGVQDKAVEEKSTHEAKKADETSENKEEKVEEKKAEKKEEKKEDKKEDSGDSQESK